MRLLCIPEPIRPCGLFLKFVSPLTNGARRYLRRGGSIHEASHMRRVLPVLAVLSVLVFFLSEFWTRRDPSPAVGQPASPSGAPSPQKPSPGRPPRSPKATNDATKAVADALIEAKNTNRYVLLNFGANWCLECRILEETFAEPSVSDFLKANFVVVPVSVGQMVGRNYSEETMELVKKYGVFTTKENTGIPSIVILDSGDNVLARTDAECVKLFD